MAVQVREVGRNEPCPCGSGKKYKQCHASKAARMTTGQTLMLILVSVILVRRARALPLRRVDGAPAGVPS
jgi:hypothetical protein